MIEILRNKNLATRFQILTAIADSGPNVRQQEIARKLNVTPQAISDYVAQLIGDGLLSSDGRSHYKVTPEGVNWVIRMLRELKGYAGSVEKAITNISVCTAVAECNLAQGETVSLRMKQGLLYAGPPSAEGARGVTTSDAQEGEDVGVTTIEGIVELKIGSVTIFRVPDVGKGGFRNVNLTNLKRGLKDRRFVGALGIEAVVTLQRAGANFQMYGVPEAAIEAAYCGLKPAVACAEDRIYSLIRRLEEADLEYEIVDIEKK